MAEVMVVSPEWYMSCDFEIVPVEVLTVAGLGLMDTVLRIGTVVVSYQYCLLKVLPVASFLARYVQ